jgi:hypothetical protein
MPGHPFKSWGDIASKNGETFKLVDRKVKNKRGHTQLDVEFDRLDALGRGSRNPAP